MRPNLFANTPDILHEYLQTGGRPAFQIRLVLAATLGAATASTGRPSSCASARACPGTEEYLDSEKYQVRHWDLDARDGPPPLITRVNRIRRENPALQPRPQPAVLPRSTTTQLIAYGKTTPDLSNVLIVVVNLDPHHTQSGWLELPLRELGLDPDQSLPGPRPAQRRALPLARTRNYVELDPQALPAHIFRVRRRIRTEQDFDYFL